MLWLVDFIVLIISIFLYKFISYYSLLYFAFKRATTICIKFGTQGILGAINHSNKNSIKKKLPKHKRAILNPLFLNYIDDSWQNKKKTILTSKNIIT